jgi:uncharacterized delta-60 repeat protein
MNANPLLKKVPRALFTVSIVTILLSATNVLAAAGTLDSTFGTNGVVTVQYNGLPSPASEVVLQADGKIVILGTVTLNYEPTGLITRYNSNGTLDTSFGVNGSVPIEVELFTASKIGLQADGKLIVGGTNWRGYFAVVRYSSNGTLDTSFGTNGLGVYDWSYNEFQQSLADMAVHTDGKIVLVGDYTAGQSNYADFSFARFNSDGTKDIGNNMISFPNSRYNYGRAVVIQPDGKIIISGNMTDYDRGDTHLSLVRLNPDGSLDKSAFGNGSGTVATRLDFQNGRGALALQTDGKIIVAGNNFSSGDLTLVRYNANGTLDTSFGGTGIVATDFGADESLDDFVIQPDGKILVEGKASSLDTSDFLLFRYNSDGLLDTSFGTNGKVTTDFGNSADFARGIALQADGKAIVVGSNGTGGILARYDTGLSMTPTTLTFDSVGAYDGWILEFLENSNKGGTLEKKSNLMYVGDDAKDRQYRGILSFNTDSIPDNAVITSAQVKIKRQSFVGTNPVNTHGALLLEIRNGTFNNDISLTLEDFSAAAGTGSTRDTFSGADANFVHTAALGNTNLGLINKLGVTQFRLLFSKDDNDDMGADYIKLFTGDSINDHPKLVITYSTAGPGPANQPPVITSNGGGAMADISLPEKTTSVTAVTATDPDGQTLTYSITGGADAALFSINPSDGTLSFLTAPSYNAPNDAGLDHIYNVTVQVSDGTLTDSQELVITILNPPPASLLDPTFGTNGVVTTKINGLPTSTHDIVLQPDGRIITLGSVQSQRVITRYNSNGSLDTSFGTNGSTYIEVTPFWGSKIALQTDGKLIVAGSSNSSFVAARYNSNGTSLDNTFGVNGIATIPLVPENHSYGCSDLVIQPDGRIVIVGTETNQGNFTNIAVARFNSDGTRDFMRLLDKYDFPNNRFNSGDAVVIQPDNKIVISGGMMDDDAKGQLTLARLNPDGLLDKSTFGTNGKGTVMVAISSFHSHQSSVAIQADGRIVVAGTASDKDGINNDLALTRFNSNGTLDPSFGGTGIVITDLGGAESADNLVIQPDGKILVEGTTSGSGSTDFLLVRYNSDGSLDTSFGSGGKIVTDYGNSADTSTGIALQTDGKVIVSGNSGENAILTRYVFKSASGTTKTTSFKSVDGYDGWILESGENTNKGGTLDKNSNVFFVGDDDKDRQYRGILSFDTSYIPDTVTITSAQLKVKKQTVVGTDPFNTHGNLLLEIRKGPFSNDIVLNLGDFSALAESGSTQDKFSAADGSWYTASLSNINLGLINKYGSTQFRLLFSKDDNDDMGADYIKFFSGNYTTSQPELFITYSTSGGTGNQAPVINGGAALSISIPENTTTVAGVTAADPDGQPITYSISGSDAGRFSINSSTGILTFLTAPDFDSMSPGTVYHVTARASDGSLTSTQEISVTVTPVNEFVPSIASSAGANISVAENTTYVTTLTATDGDLPAPSIQFVPGGADGQLFNFDSATGKLSFITPPIYGAPNDAGADHIYNVSIEVSDEDFVVTIELVVTVLNPNSAAGFTALHQFGSQADNGRVPYGVLVPYNGVFYGTTTYGGPPYNVPPTNPANKGNVFKMNMDGTGFTVLHEFVGGNNDGWKPWSGLAVSGNMVYGSTVYGGPRGESGGVIYKMDTNGSGFRVLHAFGETGDGFGGSTSPILVGETLYGLTRWGGNGTGTIYSYNTTTDVYKQLHRFAANGSNGSSPLGTLTAGNDGYLYGLTWLGGKNNLGTLFRIKTDGTGFETLYHFAGGTQGKYPYDTLVFDGSHTLYGATLGEYGVNLSDLGTVFKYDITGKTYSVLHKFAGGTNDSGKPNGSVVLSPDGITLYGTTHGDDAWGGNEFGILYQMNVDGSMFKKLYEFDGGMAGATPMRTPLLIDGALYGMTAYGGAENYGLIYRYRASNAVSNTISDASASRTRSTAMSVSLFNPVITSSGEVSTSENNTAVTTVTTDNPAQPLNYSITGGVDSAFFNIDASKGDLSFNTAPNYEAPVDAGLDNIYNVTVQASDGMLAATQDVVIKVTSVNDSSPVITSNSAISIPENTTAVTTATATDSDLPAQPLTLSISGGSDSALFSINSSTGELTFITAPNYEAPKDAGADNIYNITLQVLDGERVSTQDIAVTVNAVNDNTPVITSIGNLSISENTATVTTVTATDADLPAQPLTYSITGGSDSALFTINSSTGELTFITTPNFEIPADAGLDNIYNITIQTSDGTLTAAQDVSVTVTAVNDNTPVISSIGAISIPENTTATTTVTATDADLPAQPLTYSIASGADSALFTINSSTGELTFITTPDYEMQKDAGMDNVYNITIQTSDGTLTTTQDVSVTVTPVSDNIPVITSTAALSIPENSTAITTVTATDSDLPAQPLTYSITGGADSTLFMINSSTGKLTFIAAPDYETPKDSEADNIYNVTVQASDGTLNATQDITVTIAPVNDNSPVITSLNSFSVPENASTVAAIAATDADRPTESLIYSIVDSLDAARFSIVSATGILTFITTPDFKIPKDFNADNVYEIIVQVSDGIHNTTQNTTVRVTSMDSR